jgi:ATP-dependent RNA helicase DHX8/PRP22
MPSKLECSEDILIIVFLLSVQGIWYRPKHRELIADAIKVRLNQHEGDHITLLHVFREWQKANYSEQLCKDYYVHYRSLTTVIDIMEQLKRQMLGSNLPIVPCGNNTEPILKAIVSGFFAKAVRKVNENEYRTLVDDYPVSRKCIVWFRTRFHEIINTTKEYMRNTIETQTG